MKIISFFVAFFMFCGTANAIECSNIDVTGYSDVQLSSIKTFCDERDKIEERRIITVNEEYVGQVLYLSKKVGLSPSEYLNTFSGKILSAKYAWELFVWNIFGIIFIILIWGVAFKLFQKIAYTVTDYKIEPFLFFHRKIPTEIRLNNNSDTLFGMVVTVSISIVITAVTASICL